MMEELCGGESDDPEAGDERAHGEHPFANGAVVGGQLGGFADAEDLAADANGHEENAEREGEPSHGVTFVPYFGHGWEAGPGILSGERRLTADWEATT